MISIESAFRIVLLGLVAANVVVFAWWLFGHAPATPDSQLPDLNVKSIRLLADVAGAQSTVHAQRTSVVAERDTVLAEQDSIVAGDNSVAAEPPSPELAAAPAEESSVVPDAETTVATTVATSTPEGAHDDAPPAAASPAACLTFGPFDTRADVGELAARIEAQGGKAQVEEQVVQGKPDYLVYIEPAASRESARRVLKELKGQSIDCYIIGGGELVNGVSVGVFTQIALAEAQLQRVADLGYPVNLKPLERSYTVYRLRSDENSVRGLDDVAAAPCEPVAYEQRIL